MHDHPSAQVLVVLEGRIAVTTEADGAQELGPMDAAYIPGNEPHIVTNVLDTPSAGVDIFVPGRSFDFWLKRLRQPGSADEGQGILGSSS
jgi:quercetin dioxygenase-like cupin family protein